MEPRLKREQPFSADSGIAVVIRSVRQTDGQPEADDQAPSQRP